MRQAGIYTYSAPCFWNRSYETLIQVLFGATLSYDPLQRLGEIAPTRMIDPEYSQTDLFRLALRFRLRHLI